MHDVQFDPRAELRAMRALRRRRNGATRRCATFFAEDATFSDVSSALPRPLDRTPSPASSRTVTAEGHVIAARGVRMLDEHFAFADLSEHVERIRHPDCSIGQSKLAVPAVFTRASGEFMWLTRGPILGRALKVSSDVGAVAAQCGWPHLPGPPRPQTSPVGQLPQSSTLPQPSPAWPHWMLCAAQVCGTQLFCMPHLPGPPPPQYSPVRAGAALEEVAAAVARGPALDALRRAGGRRAERHVRLHAGREVEEHELEDRLLRGHRVAVALGRERHRGEVRRRPVGRAAARADRGVGVPVAEDDAAALVARLGADRGVEREVDRARCRLL